MKARSTVMPDAIWIRGFENGIRTINLTKNVSQEKEVNNDGSEQVFFEYDEITVKIQERDNLTQFITENFENLFLLGKQQKAETLIRQASKECNKKILDGFDSNCLGVVKHFDAELTDQATIQGLTITAMLGLNKLTTEETHWKATGELSCYKFEYTQIIKLATDLKKHVEDNINQFNSERLSILNECSS